MERQPLLPNLEQPPTPATAKSALVQSVLGTRPPPPFPPIRSQVARMTLIFLLFYLAFGILVYAVGRGDGEFKSHVTTIPVVDALYFSVVTMFTVGYGDITPKTPLAKLFSVAFVLIGFGFIDILLSGTLSYLLEVQEEAMLKKQPSPLVMDVKKRRIRMRTKAGLAVGVVVVCVGAGMVVAHFVEKLPWVDALYLSVISVTTVGYGDESFKTMWGRLLASIWLLLSTMAVARAFLYIVEARIERRHRIMENWVLTRDLTYDEFMQADMDRTGSLSKSEYMLFKLREMGKISEMDMLLVSNQFERLDIRKSGKITLSALLESRQKFSHCLDNDDHPI